MFHMKLKNIREIAFVLNACVSLLKLVWKWRNYSIDKYKKYKMVQDGNRLGFQMKWLSTVCCQDNSVIKLHMLFYLNPYHTAINMHIFNSLFFGGVFHIDIVQLIRFLECESGKWNVYAMHVPNHCLMLSSYFYTLLK